MTVREPSAQIFALLLVSKTWFSGQFILQSSIKILTQEDELICTELKCSRESSKHAERLKNLSTQIEKVFAKISTPRGTVGKCHRNTAWTSVNEWDQRWRTYEG